MPIIEAECEYCGRTVRRPHGEIRRVKHVYCCRDHAALARRKGGGIEWLNAATDPDEVYLVQRILLKYAELKKERPPDDEYPGSERWERLSAEHSLLLDITRDILCINGKLPPSFEGDTWRRGRKVKA